MNTIFKKLNFKNQPFVHILHAPDSFRPSMTDMADMTNIIEETPSKDALFILIFVTKQAELNEIAQKVPPALIDDGTLWIAYPKKGSKKYTCDFDRDSGWEIFGEMGFEGVRMVAIDDDWSALRLRRVGFIKNMKRDTSRAMTKEGKTRVKKS